MICAALSASSKSEEIAEFMEVGIKSFLTKPVEITTLFKTLMRYLDYTYCEKTDGSALPSIDFSQIKLPDAPSISKLCKCMENQILKRCNEFSKVKKMAEIEEFGNEIKELGNAFDFEPLKQIGYNLIVQAVNYKIQGVENSMSDCKILHQKLVKIRNG